MIQTIREIKSIVFEMVGAIPATSCSFCQAMTYEVIFDMILKTTKWKLMRRRLPPLGPQLTINTN